MEKICCEESYVHMISELQARAKEDPAAKSKMPPLPDDALSMLPQCVIRCLPAAPDFVTAAIVLNDKKTADDSPNILNEERKQVTAHTTLTQNVSTIDCVRYSDIGKRKEEETMPAVCSDLQLMTSVGKEMMTSSGKEMTKRTGTEISETKQPSKNSKRSNKEPKRKTTFFSLSQKSLAKKRL